MTLSLSISWTFIQRVWSGFFVFPRVERIVQWNWGTMLLNVILRCVSLLPHAIQWRLPLKRDGHVQFVSCSNSGACRWRTHPSYKLKVNEFVDVANHWVCVAVQWISVQQFVEWLASYTFKVIEFAPLLTSEFVSQYSQFSAQKCVEWPAALLRLGRWVGGCITRWLRWWFSDSHPWADNVQTYELPDDFIIIEMTRWIEAEWERWVDSLVCADVVCVWLSATSPFSSFCCLSSLPSSCFFLSDHQLHFPPPMRTLALLSDPLTRVTVKIVRTDHFLVDVQRHFMWIWRHWQSMRMKCSARFSMRRDFQQDNGHFSDLDQKRNGIPQSFGTNDNKLLRKRTLNFSEPRVHYPEECWKQKWWKILNTLLRWWEIQKHENQTNCDRTNNWWELSFNEVRLIVRLKETNTFTRSTTFSCAIIGTNSGEKSQWDGRIKVILRVYCWYIFDKKIDRRSRYYLWCHLFSNSQDSGITEWSSLYEWFEMVDNPTLPVNMRFSHLFEVLVEWKALLWECRAATTGRQVFGARMENQETFLQI